VPALLSLACRISVVAELESGDGRAVAAEIRRSRQAGEKSCRWGIGTVGQARSGTVLAWTGMAMYGATAAAPPLGFWLYHEGGLTFVGSAIILLPASQR
jgi:hypothetical protein